MAIIEQSIKEKKEHWNEEYRKGVHWEEGRSKGAEKLSKMLKQGSSILDVGCGSGRNSIFFAKNGFDVTGIDISEEAIKKAREAAESQKLRIIFKVMDAENIKYEDELFDAVFANATLQFTDLEKSSEETYRILKKGGICFFNDIISTADMDGKETKRKYSAEQIVSAFGKFKILKREEFENLDEKPKPHKHKLLTLVLKKQ